MVSAAGEASDDLPLPSAGGGGAAGSLLAGVPAAEAACHDPEKLAGCLLRRPLKPAGTQSVVCTANCIIIDHFLHLNRDWSPRFSTLHDKTAGFERKRPEI